MMQQVMAEAIDQDGPLVHKWRAAHQPGDLMPVEAIGIDLRQRLRNPQALELGRGCPPLLALRIVR